jgi:hypothetical protein
MSEKEEDDIVNRKLNTIVIVQICVVVLVLAAAVAAAYFFYKLKRVAGKHSGVKDNVLVTLENVKVPEPINLSEMEKKVQNLLTEDNIKMVQDIGKKIQEEKAIENIKALKEMYETQKNNIEQFSQNFKEVNKSLKSLAAPVQAINRYFSGQPELKYTKIPSSNPVRGRAIETGTVQFLD